MGSSVPGGGVGVGVGVDVSKKEVIKFKLIRVSGGGAEVAGVNTVWYSALALRLSTT